MTPDGIASVLMWLIGGLIVGISILIATNVKLTLEVRTLNANVEHWDDNLSSFRHDTKEKFDEIWDTAREQGKQIGEIDRRVTRLEPKRA